MAKTKLFYWIQFSRKKTRNAWREVDIKCISTKLKTVEGAWNKVMPDRRFNTILSLVTDLDITGKSVWVIFDYDADFPSWSQIKFVGNNKEECLDWWNENWSNYCVPSVDGLPELKTVEKNRDGFVWESQNQKRIAGVRIKEILLS